MSAESFAASAPQVATRAELDALRDARAKPVAEAHLTIGGWQETDVRRDLATLSEKRITHLEERLQRVREDALRDHRLGALHGRAKVDFGQSR